VQVSPGSECTFAQDVMAINTAGKDCCAIGELGKRAVVTPDIEFNLNSVINLD
jgi:DNA-directed RNA polymerase III subunit RPC4